MLQITVNDQLYSAGFEAGRKVAHEAAAARKPHEGHLTAIAHCDYNAALHALGLIASYEAANAFQRGLDSGIVAAVAKQKANRQ